MKKTKLMSQLVANPDPEFVENLTDAMDLVRTTGDDAIVESPDGTELVVTDNGDGVIVTDPESGEATKLTDNPVDKNDIVMESVPSVESEDIPSKIPNETSDTSAMEEAAMELSEEDLEDIESEDETGAKEERYMSSKSYYLIGKSLKKPVELKLVDGNELVGDYSGDQLRVYVLPDDTVTVGVLVGKVMSMFEPVTKSDLNGDTVRKSKLVRDSDSLTLTDSLDKNFSRKYRRHYKLSRTSRYSHRSRVFSDQPEPEVASSVVIEGLDGIGEDTGARVLKDLVIEADSGIVDEDNPATKPFSFKFKNFSKLRAKRLIRAFCDTYYKAHIPEDAESVEDAVDNAQKCMSNSGSRIYLSSSDLPRPLEVEWVSGDPVSPGIYDTTDESDLRVESEFVYGTLRGFKVTRNLEGTPVVSYYLPYETKGIEATDYQVFISAGAIVDKFMVIEGSEDIDNFSDSEDCSEDPEPLESVDVAPKLRPEVETKSRKFSNTKRSIINPLLYTEIY